MENLNMVLVPGGTFKFNEEREVTLPDYHISAYPVTQALWTEVMGGNPARYKDPNRPVEHVSWDRAQDFLKKLGGNYRLPSEAEWEYVARGGQQTDHHRFSGSNDLNEVGWYELNAGPHSDLETIRQYKNQQKGTETHPVGQKAPNQLGLYDLSGNVWEWCQDIYTPDINLIPKDGSPYTGAGKERVLRGGCHHNWDIHCTVAKRYAIVPEAADECIGFRIAASIH